MFKCKGSINQQIKPDHLSFQRHSGTMVWLVPFIRNNSQNSGRYRLLSNGFQSLSHTIYLTRLFVQNQFVLCDNFIDLLFTIDDEHRIVRTLFTTPKHFIFAKELNLFYKCYFYVHISFPSDFLSFSWCFSQKRMLKPFNTF